MGFYLSLFVAISLSIVQYSLGEDLDMPVPFKPWDFQCPSDSGVSGMTFWMHKVGISARDPMVHMSCDSLSSVGAQPLVNAGIEYVVVSVF